MYYLLVHVNLSWTALLMDIYHSHSELVDRIFKQIYKTREMNIFAHLLFVSYDYLTYMHV